MTQDEALALWEYRDGNLYWRESVAFRVKAGDKAGTLHTLTRRKHTSKYIRVCYDHKSYMAHRIIFLMHHGYLPEQIDHIDGNGLNNDIENLRAATGSENQANKGKPSNNTSGFKGVSWNKKNQTWEASIVANNKKRFLGYFDSPEDAHYAYCTEASNTFGVFANSG